MHFLKRVLHTYDDVISMLAENEFKISKEKKLIMIDTIIRELKDIRKDVCNCKKH